MTATRGAAWRDPGARRAGRLRACRPRGVRDGHDRDARAAQGRCLREASGLSRRSSEILPVLRSISRTCTLTVSPSCSTSSTEPTRPLATREMCSRPSLPGVSLTKAPKSLMPTTSPSKILADLGLFHDAEDHGLGSLAGRALDSGDMDGAIFLDVDLTRRFHPGCRARPCRRSR